eukprot:994302-Rhodomonas_salina.1
MEVRLTCMAQTRRVFDLMTCKAIRRLNGDPGCVQSLWDAGQEAAAQAASPQQACAFVLPSADLVDSPAGARRVALQAMPMVAERGDDAAIAA